MGLQGGVCTLAVAVTGEPPWLAASGQLANHHNIFTIAVLDVKSGRAQLKSFANGVRRRCAEFVDLRGGGR
eukprot:8142777-Pyramimonas_sp.AAC.2